MVLSNAQWFASPGAYEIDQSCRFNDDDSSYLYRTPASASNSKTWTASMWVKRSNLGDSVSNVFFAASESGLTTSIGTMDAGDYDRLYINMSGSTGITTQVFRDPAAWFHLHWAMDTTQSTAANRMKLSINGVQVTAFDSITYPSLNHDTTVNKDEFHGWARNSSGGNQLYDGYLAECYLIDGIVTTPSDFGEVSSSTGQWIPKAYGGSFGTNGFHLDFADSSALGNDVSGNDNDFTSSGLAAADQMTDSPTNNYATMSPLNHPSLYELSDGNLYCGFSFAGTNSRGTTATMAYPRTGKWYWEGTNTVGDQGLFGVRAFDGTQSVDDFATVFNVNSVNAYGIYSSNGALYEDGSSSSTGETWGNGDTIGVAFDVDTGKLWFSKNGSWASGNPADGSSPSATVPSAELANVIYPWGGCGSNTHFQTYDFGQSGFRDDPPTGFSALSTANLPDPTIDDPSAYSQPTIYSGNGGSNEIDQTGNSTFEPDMIWIKERSSTNHGTIIDSVRGGNKGVYPSTTAAEYTESNLSFDADGFSLTTTGSSAQINHASQTYVAWQWLKGTTGALDIVTYTGTGSTRTVSHGLGVKPDLMIFKRRDGTQNWRVYHHTLTAENSLFLDLTNAQSDDTAPFNDTEPTSSVFTVKSDGTVNATDQTYVAWLFAGVEGFSSFGKFTGNGSADGPFLWMSFAPSAFILKRFDSTGNWRAFDNRRGPFNENDNRLEINNNNAEASGDGEGVDFLSNGVKIRSSDAGWNASGGNYLWMAWADTPFKTATAR